MISMMQIFSAFLAFLCLTSGTSASFTRLRSSGFAIPGNATYDYVVVGGGIAGLTLASRLAEFASVGVIEAGGIYEQDNGNLSITPYGAAQQLFIDTSENYARQPLVDWDLVSIPQTGAGNRKMHYAQGKTLGGGSGVNLLAYHRGTIGTYQRWADLVGDQSYTFPNLLPYFQKSCHLTPPDLGARNTPNATPIYDPSAFDNSKGGILQVSWNKWVDPTINQISHALQSFGLTESKEGFSSGSLSGHGAWIPATINPKHSTRSSSYSSFLKHALENTEIMVHIHTQAQKIIFDTSTPKRAIGVSVSTAGFEYFIGAKKEVIVSAGVTHSPQLLMVSGVGPRKTLEKFNIPVISDLPGVGQNFWEQPAVPMAHIVTTPNQAGIIKNPATANAVLQEYLTDGTGPYGSLVGYLSFEKLPDSVRRNFSKATQDALNWFPNDWPDIEWLVAGISGPNGSSFAISSGILQTPSSRGSVSISSTSMLDQPVLDFGYLTHPADAEAVVAIFKRQREWWATPLAKSVVVGPEADPGPAVQSDAEILAFIRENMFTNNHGSGTCKMGKQSDVNAVVNSNGKVFGTKGLRVVDASTFPFGLPGHPQASVYMLAEKIASDIKNGN